MIEKSIIPPLLRQIEESNQIWENALRKQNRILSFEDPSTRPADRQNKHILSVFDRHLPVEFASDFQAAQLWAKRQEMEVFLVHPGFPLTARNFIFNRLQIWMKIGFKNAFREDCFDPVTKIRTRRLFKNS